MNAAIVAAIFLLGGRLAAVEFERIFPADALDSEKQVRRCLDEAFPGLKALAYQWDGQLGFGIFRVPGEPRVLLHWLGSPIGDYKISINGKEVEQAILKPATVVLVVPLPSKDGKDSGEVIERIVGFWLPLKLSEHFRFSAHIEYPIECQLEANYDPDLGWQISCKRVKESAVRAESE